MHSVWIITIHIIMVSVLKCHIIYLLFKKSKSILLVEIVLCWDWSLSHVQHHPFSEIYICRKSYNWLNLIKQEILFLDFAAKKRNIFSRPGQGINSKRWHCVKMGCLKLCIFDIQNLVTKTQNFVICGNIFNYNITSMFWKSDKQQTYIHTAYPWPQQCCALQERDF